MRSRPGSGSSSAPLGSPDGARAFTRYLAETLAARELGAFAGELAARRRRGEAFPVPLCLTYARQDPMVPPRVGARLAALLPEAEMHWLEDSSHFAHVDSPERVVPILERFLAG